MWLAVTLAFLGLLAPPEPGADPPGASEPIHRAPVGRLSSWFGPAIATGLSARRYGDPHRELDEGQLAALTQTVGLSGRLAGYAEHEARRSRAITMLMPELSLDLELGGTASWRDALAEQRGLAGKQGVAAGIGGGATIVAGWASPGVVGIYARVSVGQRFSARTNTDLEGPWLIATLGPGLGLRVAWHRRFTVLLGGGVDAVAGVQRFDDRGRLIAQLAPVVELATYTQPTPDIYFGVVARGGLTALGEQWGGRRLHARASAELGWRLPWRAATRGPKPARFAALLLTWEGTQIDAAPGHPQFAELGERRVGHQLRLAGGVSF
ncbi:hypothetical protein ACNOYE_30160 [Nannocystaceae bacterium ST9]